jgi:hydrogenase 3 maturation protease
MKENLVITVGNGMMGDDGAGTLLAQLMQQAPVAGWDVINGGSAPENILYQVRELAPARVLVVDAADMDLPPGSIRLIPGGKLEDPFLMTTHALPLTYLIEALHEFVPQVDLLGIQPEVVAFGYTMSDCVKDAVSQIYKELCDGVAGWEIL